MKKTLKVLLVDVSMEVLHRRFRNLPKDFFNKYREQGFNLILFSDTDHQFIKFIESGETPTETEELIAHLRDMTFFKEEEFEVADDSKELVHIFHVCLMENTTKEQFFKMFQGDHEHYVLKQSLLSRIFQQEDIELYVQETF